jgi:DNA-binding PadR family transcriptional regulator
MRRGAAEVLGEFEQLVLLAIARLEGDAYAVSIRREIERRTGRRISRGAIYVTLRRLSAKAFLDSRMGDPTPERGGRSKRLYRLRPSGLLVLEQSLAALDRMRAGLSAGLREA